MRTLHGLSLGFVLVVAAAAVTPAVATDGEKMSHAHMGHVTTAWGDTPDGMGLLPTAAAEAEIAALHAGLAMQKPADLGWLQTHARHILHAVDPSVEAAGPGLGYGVIKAAGGAAKHIDLAAQSDDASDNIRAHAVHVGASTQNAVDRANEIVALGLQVIAAENAADAAPLVEQIALLVDQLLLGVDANGDGDITWQQGEGGLNEAARHMGFMEEGEGIS